MRITEPASRLSGMLLLSGMIASPAVAGTITINCDADPAYNSPPMTFVYDGEAEGTLSIKGPFGEISLPASKQDLDMKNAQGQQGVTSISGSARVKVQMPDGAAVEACVKGKQPPDQLADKDIVSLNVMSCLAETPPGAAPAEIDAMARIALSPAPDAYITFNRTYVEPTDLVTGQIALETALYCMVKE
jgi:hypothetical protein